MNIKEIVRNTAEFDYYRQGHLFYRIYNSETKSFYRFSIPMTDTGDASFHSTEKGLTLMRWIRKAIENDEFVKIAP